MVRYLDIEHCITFGKGREKGTGTMVPVAQQTERVCFSFVFICHISYYFLLVINSTSS